MRAESVRFERGRSCGTNNFPGGTLRATFPPRDLHSICKFNQERELTSPAPSADAVRYPFVQSHSVGVQQLRASWAHKSETWHEPGANGGSPRNFVIKRLPLFSPKNPFLFENMFFFSLSLRFERLRLRNACATELVRGRWGSIFFFLRVVK